MSAGLAVVSYHARDPFTPRGKRTLEIVKRLAEDWVVEVVAGPEPVRSTRPRPVRRTRQLARRIAMLVLLDMVEPASRKAFRRWQPDCAAALVVAAPFSHAVLAAKRIRAAGIPYILDVGDPWVLTANPAQVRGLALARARRLEAELWAGAAGGIVTTAEQGARLSRRFPELPLLVRPNGCSADTVANGRHDPDEGGPLRLVHYGHFYAIRGDPTDFLRRLSTGERPVELHVFGRDWERRLSRARGVTVVFHDQQPWHELVATATRFDAALVVGNLDPAQLPSKAIEYLALPIPRVAVVASRHDDALAEYVADKRGWLTLELTDPDPAAAIAAHVARAWPASDARSTGRRGLGLRQRRGR